jgi:hypothetical protein
MSGESEILVGVLALPLLAVAGAGYLAFKLGEASVNGIKSLNEYHNEKKKEREFILDNTSGELKDILSLFNETANAFSEKYGNVIKQTEENISQVSREFNVKAKRLQSENLDTYKNDVQRVSKAMSEKFKKDFDKIQMDYAEETDKKIKAFAMQSKKTFESQAAKISELANNHVEQNNYRRKLSEKAIESTEEQLRYIKNHTTTNSSYYDKINMLKAGLDNMRGMFEKKMYEASYAMAESIKNVALGIFYDMALEKNQIENYREMLHFELTKLKSLVDDNSEIQFKYDDCIIRASIYDYSEGLIEGFSRRVDECERNIERASSLKELKKIYEEVVYQLSPSFTNIWNWSAKNLENAYVRRDIAQTVTDTLEKQGFTVAESGYKGSSDKVINRGNPKTHDFYVKFENKITKEKILIVVKPEDRSQKVETSFEIHQLTENINPDRQEEIRLDVVRGVSDYYEKKDFTVKPCLEKSVGKPSKMQNFNMDKIKETEQSRTPKI